MNDTHRPFDRARVVAALRELVEALDRRVPRVERLGEVVTRSLSGRKPPLGSQS